MSSRIALDTASHKHTKLVRCADPRSGSLTSVEVVIVLGSVDSRAKLSVVSAGLNHENELVLVPRALHS